MSKRLIHIVDMQGDFIYPKGNLAIPGAMRLISATNDYFMRSFCDGGTLVASRIEKEDSIVGIIVSLDTHTPEDYVGSPEGEQFPPHCYKYTPGWYPCVDLKAMPPLLQDNILYVEKDVFDIWEKEDTFMYHFFATNENPNDLWNKSGVRFQTYVDSYYSDDLVVEVFGVASDFCVKWAVQGYVNRGFNVEIKQDLCAGIEKDIKTVYEENWAGNKRVNLI